MKQFCVSIVLSLSACIGIFCLEACAQKEPGPKASPENWVGKPYPAYSDPEYLLGYESLGGSLITAAHLQEQVIVSLYRKEKRYLILFSHRSSDRDSFYIIRKALEIDSIPEGYDVVHGVCRLDSLDQPGIVAIMKPVGEYSTEIYKAWLYDWVDDILTEPEAARVDCYNTLFDLTRNKISLLNKS